MGKPFLSLSHHIPLLLALAACSDDAAGKRLPTPYLDAGGITDGSPQPQTDSATAMQDVDPRDATIAILGATADAVREGDTAAFFGALKFDGINDISLAADSVGERVERDRL